MERVFVAGSSAFTIREAAGLSAGTLTVTITRMTGWNGRISWHPGGRWPSARASVRPACGLRERLSSCHRVLVRTRSC